MHAATPATQPPGAWPKLRALGLDEAQVAACTASQPSTSAPLPACVRVGCVLASGPGYFKLQYGPGARLGGGSATSSGTGKRGLLVVAFGSAPGTPNFGGLLRRVYSAAQSEEERWVAGFPAPR